MTCAFPPLLAFPRIDGTFRYQHVEEKKVTLLKM
jgi:hypothetical protein